MTGSAQQLNDHDRELLSSYIDDALTASEREALEKRLAHEPELHIELDELHSVVQALHSLRAVSPPRSFTIDLAAEAKARPWWMSIRGMFGATGTIAALFVLTWVSISMLNGSQAATYSTAMAPSEAAGTERSAAELSQSYAPATPAATTAPAAAEAAAATVAPAAAATSAPAATEAAGIAAAPMETGAPAFAATEAPPAVAMAPPVTLAATTEAPIAEPTSEASADAQIGAATTNQATALGATPASLAQEATPASSAKQQQGNAENASSQQAPQNTTPSITTILLGLAIIALAVFVAIFVMRRRV